jgi:hypothetical protein
MNFLTIDECRIDNFPFKENDHVIISWNKEYQQSAVIVKLQTSMQSGRDIVHAVMVSTGEKPFVVATGLLNKTTI